MFLQIGIAYSFLLNSSQTGLTSFEFQHLSQLIINEEQSRHHVENDVTSLEQRVAEIEHDLKSKYEKDIADAKTALERQINATKTFLEQEANSTKAAFERELNTTKALLEQQSHALEKEKSNRRQLEREYTRLMTDFRNVSLAYDGLVAKDTELQEKIANQTNSFASKCDSLNADIETLNSSSNLLHTNIWKNTASISSNIATISTLMASTGSLNAKTGRAFFLFYD